MSDFSIVEYFAEHAGYRCGYCKSEDTNLSHGMWAHAMTVEDYQNLIDRGWRRSGKYCYKPTMKSTCCPQYTIRCAALEFKLSKSQKKVLKRMHKFLSCGKNDFTGSQDSSSLTESFEGDTGAIFPSPAQIQKIADQAESHKDEMCLEKDSTGKENTSDINPAAVSDNVECNSSQACDMSAEVKNSDRVIVGHTATSRTRHVSVKLGVGQDPDKPPCKKAKLYRKERKIEKLLKKAEAEGKTVTDVEELLHSSRKSKNEQKSVEDFLSESFPEFPSHKLELRLVPSNLGCPDFEQTFEESYSVYQKYQVTIHNDPPEKCSKKQFTRFLVDSPLQALEDPGGIPKGYGSFHQQYWLDDHLIAVGVLDILPKCVSSVYFYYDPDYSFLSLGTYAALREIALTRSLNKQTSQLQYYYMGFYIHSCQKMRYKGQFSPSFLLCPETYTWNKIEKCCPKLDISKYSRLEEDSQKGDPGGNVHLEKIMVLHQRRAMPYSIYQYNRYAKDEEEVREYAGLVGEKCYNSILLYRS